MNEYRASYDIATDNIEAIRYQAREEIAMKKMFDAEGCKAFSNTFPGSLRHCGSCPAWRAST